MKKNLLCILASALCLGLFSNGYTADNLPEYWQKWEQEKGTHECGIDKNTYLSAPDSIFIKSVKPDTDKNTGIVQLISIDKYKGKRIRFSAKMKAKDVKDRGWIYARSGNIYPSSGISGTKDWTYFVLVFDIPENHRENIELAFSLWKSGQIWIDDIRWETVDKSVPVTYVAPLSEPVLKQDDTQESDGYKEYKKGNAYYNNGDYAQAVVWYQKAANKGVSQAQYELGLVYMSGEGVSKNYNEGVSWLKKAAEQGHAQAQYNLSLAYYKGNGVAKSSTQSINWLTKSAEKGYEKAQNELGKTYRDGDEGVSKDLKQSIKWFRKSAEQGFPEAQYNLGVVLLQQNEKDKEAIEWFLKAAEQGFMHAQYDVGAEYYLGRNISQDFSKSAYWFKKAAEQGYAVAQSELGKMYLEGKGVAKDFVQADYWCRKGAEQGNAQGQHCLRVMEALEKARD